MKLKDKLLELNKTYDQTRIEAVKLIQSIKPKVKTIADAQIVQELLENKDFYWKHDLLSIKQIAKTYNIDMVKLEILVKKYVESEQKLIENKKQFEQLGLKDLSFGPKTLLSASGDQESSVYIYFKDNGLDISIYPENGDTGWTEDFEKFSDQIRKRIRNLLEKDI